jgi:hypothetical protein
VDETSPTNQGRKSSLMPGHRPQLTASWEVGNNNHRHALRPASSLHVTSDGQGNSNSLRRLRPPSTRSHRASSRLSSALARTMAAGLRPFPKQATMDRTLGGRRGTSRSATSTQTDTRNQRSLRSSVGRATPRGRPELWAQLDKQCRLYRSQGHNTNRGPPHAQRVVAGRTG